jgi:hypothetical protein
MPNRPHESEIANKLSTPLPRTTRPFSAIPQYYSPFPECPPTCPGWYFCWSGPTADYLYWPGEWDGVTHYVELPEFVQEILKTDPKVV